MVAARTADGSRTSALSMAQYQSLAATTQVFDAVGGLASGQRPILTGAGDPRRFNVECVTADLFRVLGTTPAMGRTFTRDEDRPGADAVVVLSYQFWQRDLNGARDAVGRVLTLNGVPTTVVGIMPRDFAGPYSRNNNDGWLPAGPALAGGASAGCIARGTVWAFAKLKPGVTLDAASALATDVSGVQRLPDWRGRTGAKIELISQQEQTVGDLRAPLLALLGAVGLVLLIACANVANLQMERIFGRRSELAVRMALGATRWRTIRQTLTEAMLLSLLGGVAGLLAAGWTLQLIVSLMPAYIPHLNDIAINGRILAMTVALSCATAMAIGFIPAMQGRAASLSEDLRATTRTASRGAGWMRRALVATQIGLSLTLLVGASLMMTSFRTLRPSDPGFNGTNKLFATVRLQGRAATTPGSLFDHLIDRVAAIPGVRAASGTTYLPMSGTVAMVPVRTENATQEIWSGIVTTNYFREMEVPIVRGRGFDDRDLGGASKVAVVNEAFVRRMFPGSDAIGRLVNIDFYDRQQGPRQIVGVVRDTRSAGGDLRSRAEIYIPLRQATTTLLHVIVTADRPGDPRLSSQLRAVLAEIDPTQVVDRVMPMQEMLDATVSTWRFGASLLGLFAVMAIVLAGVGLAASITWWVTQRTREIGVRMALGANANAVAALVMRQGLVVATFGIALGLAGAAASTRLIGSWLYGITPLDARTFALSALGMLAVAAAASYLPARRASRVDPIIALRAE
jgi:predicted permease